MGLGTLGDEHSSSYATGVSADGSVVVGSYFSIFGSHPDEAFRWTLAGGMVGLGHLSVAPGADPQSAAAGVSGDGNVVVGTVRTNNPWWVSDGLRWTTDQGMSSLGGVANGNGSAVYAASANGSIVVGYSALRERSYRWSEANGYVDFPYLAGDLWDLSADGTVAVGRWGNEAILWTEGEEVHRLGDLPGSTFYSDAKAVSANGTTIVGFSNSSNGQEAFRWTADGGMVGLGDLPGGHFESAAYDVSADGGVVIGKSWAAGGYRAFYWSAATGMVNLADLLISNGATGLAGWQLESAQGISANGRTIVGQGYNPNGYAEAWVATLPLDAIPGDFDGNQFVDANDLDAWKPNIGLASGANLADGDADNDGDVDGNDFLIWQRHVGQGVPPSLIAAPEPVVSLTGLVMWWFVAQPMVRGSKLRAKRYEHLDTAAAQDQPQFN